MIDLSIYFDGIKRRKSKGTLEFFCRIRHIWLLSTPEELVRQASILHLLYLGYSEKLITVEKKLDVNGLYRRTDAMVWNKNGECLLLLECKAPTVNLDQEVFDQINSYNSIIGTSFIWITNGHNSRIYKVNKELGQLTEMSSLPLPQDSII